MKPWKYKWIVIGLVLLITISEGKKKVKKRKPKKNFSAVLGTEPESGLQNNASDGDRGLFPNVFNLATDAVITANATCGDPVTEVYCKLVEHVFLRSPQCGVCDSSAYDPSFRHPISNAVDGTPSWWQSPTLQQGSQYEWITITLDLRQVFQVAYIVVKSAISPRPGNWILERSVDGESYEPWQYYAINDGECMFKYGIEPKGNNQMRSDSEVICTSEFSKIHPLEDGEIHTSLVNGRPGAQLPSDEIRNFTRARFVRLRLQKIRTLNAELMTLNSPKENDDSLYRRFFYSIRDISIGGMCDCNGHASSCPEVPATKTLTCQCEHNTCGDACGECCPLFNQLPWRPGTAKQAAICQQCNCHGHATSCRYDATVAKEKRSLDTNGKFIGGGVCNNCSDFTAGINCERCLPGYYRPSGVLPTDITPCFKCYCSPLGAIGDCVPDDSEGLVPGSCACKTGFGGLFCDQCATGYTNFPNCEPCPCNLAGTDGGCESKDCICKKNVEGVHCDRCKPGYFNLQSTNPNGCTKCWCSRQAKECESADLGLDLVGGLEGWLITDLDGRRVTQPFIEEDGHYTIADDDMLNMEKYFWSAPPRYLGRRITSYGQDLVGRVSWVKARGDTGGKPSMAYDFIIENNQTRLAYGVHYYPDDDNVTLAAPLVEDVWTDLSTNAVADRDKLMSVLLNVTRILIRAKYHTDQIEGSLHTVDMPTCSFKPAKPGEPTAPGVERCACPKGRTGLSCELCDYGFVMRAGECEPCNCNGHARSCDPDTGVCTECEHNTEGPNCSACKTGYHGDPAIEHCKRCACPLDSELNNFSPTCYSVLDGRADADFICDQCPDGFEGKRCERCSPGYFGDPTKEGDYCKPCHCPDSATCDTLTGQCLQCPGSTTGWRCDRCKDGYFGDPLTTGCKPCTCNSYGALDQECDRLTGQCKCKERFTGRNCDKCKNGFGNLAEGCPRCDCNDVGSVTSEVCDSLSGQCECHKGVQGRKCASCADEYYGFDVGGCKSCNCHEAGSVKRQCDIVTGQCICQKHVVGRACESCEPGYWNLSVANQGCTKCICDPIGSLSSTCDPSSGQCPCRPGVGGIHCDACVHGFYGFSGEGCKACEPCRKPGHVCDPDTGRCVCPPYTEGEFCERCIPGSYDHRPIGGCKPCTCKGDGTRHGAGSCDPATGRCACREGVVGEDCDRCAFGFFGFPNCRRCECSSTGTEPSACREDGLCQCDADGQCPCKVNVIGRKCNQCLDGTFGLAEENPDGCTSCFCFGKTQSCIQAQFTWSQLHLIGPSSVRDLAINFLGPVRPGHKSANQYPINPFEVCFIHLAEPGERRLSVDVGETVLNVSNNLRLIPGDSGDVTIGVTQPFNAPLYWSLPTPFLGDKILSYNGYLRFIAESDPGTQRFPASVLTTYPLVQIQGNKKLVLEYFPPLRTKSGYYLVRFHESLWRLKGQPNRQVTRQILMTALQNLENILVRATESADSRRAVLREMTMDVAVPSNDLATMPLARGVELCFCPSEYNSTSCQNPSIGFYRWFKPSYETSTIIIDLVGEARRCECNGKSDKCDKETGVCEFCQDNTSGNHCEYCAAGYFGDPAIGPCRSCACPSLDRNHADVCPTNRRSPFGHDCQCRPGYTGPRCELCAPGYFGDALEGSCEPCNCDIYGSLNQECDTRSGICRCRPGISGRHCTQCAPRHVIEGADCKSCNDGCTGVLLDDFEVLTNQLKTTNLSRVVPLPWGKINTYETRSFKITQELLDMRLTRDRAILVLDSPEFATQVDMMALRTSGARRAISDLPEEGSSSAVASNELLQTVIALGRNIEDIVADFNNYAIGESPSVNINRAVNEAEGYLAYIKGVSLDFRESAVRTELQRCTELLERVLNMVLKGKVVEEISGRLQILMDRLEDLQRHIDISLSDSRDTRTLTATNSQLLSFINSTSFMISSSKCHDDAQTAINRCDVADDILDSARQNFAKLNDLSRNFSDKYDRLSERIDMQDLEIRNEVWESVNNARVHSEELSGKAKRLFDQFNRTRGVADEPLRASGAYRSIGDAIEEARRAAEAAVNSADVTYTQIYLDVDSPSVVQRAATSRTKSEDLIKEAKNLFSSVNLHKMQFRGEQEILTEIKDTVGSGMKKHGKMNEELDKMKTGRAETESIFDKAMDVESSSLSARAKIDTTREKIALLRQRIRSLRAGGSGEEKEEVSHLIDESFKNHELLETQIITSYRRVKEIQTTQELFRLNLDELKRKIKKAKQEATGIKVSVTNAAKEKKCMRSYTPELKPSTTSSISLTFAVTGKDKNALLTYLPSSSQSDFMLVEMVNRRIRFIWSAGGSEGSVTHPVELLTSSDDLLEDSRWYRVDAERIGSVGRLSVRPVKSIDGEVTVGPISASASPAFTRTDFKTGDRLWIGGIPEGYNISTARGIPGCLHQLTVNGQQIGLWNFATNKNCGPCIEGAQEVREDSSFHFAGRGYAEVPQVPRYDPRQYSVTLAFRTFDSDALLFLASSNRTRQYMMVDIKDGAVRLTVQLGPKHVLVLQTLQSYGSGKWIKVEATRVRYKGVEKALLKVNDEELARSPWTKKEAPPDLDLEDARLFIGGTPPDFRPQAELSSAVIERHFRGCMKDIQIVATGVNPLQGSNFDVLGSCPVEPERTAGFNSRGYLQLPAHTVKKDFTLSINFRTTTTEALLLFSSPDDWATVGSRVPYYSLAIIDGRLKLNMDTGSETVGLVADRRLGDGHLHTAVVIKQDKRLELYVDEELVSSTRFTSSDGTLVALKGKHPLFVGGVPVNVSVDVAGLAGTALFMDGCVSDLIINNEIIGFDSLVKMENVSIGRCRSEEPSPTAEPSQLAQDAPLHSCTPSGLSQFDDEALSFGAFPDSFVAVPLGKNVKRGPFSNLTVEFRTFQPNGLLFYIPLNKNAKKRQYFAAALNSGRISAILSAKQTDDIQVKSSSHLSDGEWHKVTFEMTGRRLKVYLDERLVGKTELSKKYRFSHIIYIGGVPRDLKSKEPLISHGLHGCLRHLNLDGVDLPISSPKNLRNNVGQCLLAVEEGAHFSPDSYAVYDPNFKATTEMDVELQFRTFEKSGILMKVIPANGGRASLVLKFDGETMELQYGSLILQTISSTSLCNGKWHSVRWSVTQNGISLSTDGKQESYAGTVDETIQGLLLIGSQKGLTPSQPARNAFLGCMGDLMISNSVRPWKDMHFTYNIQIDSCPR